VVEHHRRLGHGFAVECDWVQLGSAPAGGVWAGDLDPFPGVRMVTDEHQRGPALRGAQLDQLVQQTGVAVGGGD
jgi:hypothetical protein